jgi:hypothetical protein
MACIARVPRCALGSSPDPVADPLKQFGAVLAAVGGLIGVLGGLGALPGIAAALGVGGAGALGGAVAVIAVLVLIGLYAFDRCLEGQGLPQCIAGCVSNIRESFSEAWEYLVPFAALHNRVDVTVKSFFWDFLELNNAYVYCTSDPYPQLSEVMHCYYYTKRVCNGAVGALYGAAIGGAAALFIAAAAAAAIGCATVILCIFALIIAAIIAIAGALIGAFAGGNIVAAATDDTPPADGSGTTVATGMLVTLNGNMEQLEQDNKANCLWWVHGTQIHGMIAAGTHQPFSYCDIDEQLAMDACPRAAPPPPR